MKQREMLGRKQIKAGQAEQKLPPVE